MRSIDRSNPEKQNEIDIAQRAIKFRDHLGISDKLYVDVVDVLEFRVKEFIPNFKLMVRRDIELDKAATTAEDPPRIFVRESIYDAACEGDQEARRILAHELAHLLLHFEIDGPKHKDFEGYDPQISGMTSLDSVEDQADIYARNLLIPPHIAYAHRHRVADLSKFTGTPIKIARAAVTISKRQEMFGVGQSPRRKLGL